MKVWGKTRKGQPYIKTRKISKYAVIGEQNGRWKGNKVSIDGVHEYVRRRLPKPDGSLCQHCGKRKPLDLANKSGNYLRSTVDWLWLCRACHMRQDHRLGNLKQFQ